MKGCNNWSYHPYKPFLFDHNEIYISRVVPGETSLCIEWFGVDGCCEVFFGKKDEESFSLYARAEEHACQITGLQTDTDYAFYVKCGEKKSRVRLARTGKSVGVVVNYLHPEDGAYGFSGQYLCSPSLVRHPDGFLLASMDVFSYGTPQNLTLVFRSDDDGETWHYVSELMPCFWGKMFIHKGELYMLSCSTEYGDLLIGKSTDGGKTFCAPITLLRGSNGKDGNCGVHKNPQNILIHNGRIYGTLEWGAWANKEFGHAAMVMSCDVNDDLLVPENWSFTEPVPFRPFIPMLEELEMPVMTIEGTLVASPQNELLNIMRFGMRNHVLAYKVDETNHEAPLTFADVIHFEANHSKFTIQYDAVSGRYYSIASRLYEGCPDHARNLLSLMVSSDLKSWECVLDILDYRQYDCDTIGFQYVDFLMEGDDILFLCRTAMNQAHNFHDSNYSTFHRIRDFRKL